MCQSGACFLRICVLLNSDISFKTDHISATALLEKQRKDVKQKNSQLDQSGILLD